MANRNLILILSLLIPSVGRTQAASQRSQEDPAARTVFISLDANSNQQLSCDQVVRRFAGSAPIAVQNPFCQHSETKPVAEPVLSSQLDRKKGLPQAVLIGG